MSDRRPETPDKLLNELHSLQALLDQEADDPGIPVLSDVVDSGDADAGEAFSPAVAASTLELDFDDFEVDEQLLRDGLGLEEPVAAPQLLHATGSRTSTADANAGAGAGTSAAGEDVPASAPHAAAVSPSRDSATATATAPLPAQDDAARADFDELVAEMLDQCLLELEDLLRPRLEQLCRDILARGTPPGGQ